MGPRPYSERSSLPIDAPSNSEISSDSAPTPIIPESPSPSTLSSATTPSPVPQDAIIIDSSTSESLPAEDDYMEPGNSSFFASSGTDSMPYDHALPGYLRQISQQQNLTSVHSLSIRVISRMTSLSRMSFYTPNLRELDLEGSMLGSLRDIGCNLKYLQVLKVGRCQLSSLDGTFGLTSLRELHASKNLITDLTPCANLPHVRYIDLSKNRIVNVLSAGFLTLCPKLRSIVFEGNPAANFFGYREHLQSILPNLQVLDNVPFLNEENNNIMNSDLIENCMDEGNPLDYQIQAVSVEEKCEEEPEKNHSQNGEKNEADLMYEAADYEVQEVFNREVLKTMAIAQQLEKLTLDDNSDTNRLGLLEQAKIKDKTNNEKGSNLRDEFENKSKRCNLTFDSDFDIEIEDFAMPSLYRPLSAFSSQQSISSSAMEEFGSDAEMSGKITQEENDFVLPEIKTISKRPATASGLRQEADDTFLGGVIKKRPSSASSISTGNKQVKTNTPILNESGVSRLTSGMPVCGNLTTALRNRKKQQHISAWEDEENRRFKQNEPLILMPGRVNEEASCSYKTDGYGENEEIPDEEKPETEDNDVDVLSASKRWREAFRKFRTSNRCRWEEEDGEVDYRKLYESLNYLKETEDFED